MMAMSKKMPEQEPSELEMLLPWHAAGTLNRARCPPGRGSARPRSRTRQAVCCDPGRIRRNHRAQRKPRRAVGAGDAEAVCRDRSRSRGASRRASSNLAARISGFFANLSPRTLAWSASLGALALLLQAGVIGAVLMKNQPATYQTASLSMNEPITRALGPDAPPRALVRFSPDARVADITALLDNYQASIVDGAKGGMFRLQFGNKSMTKDEIDAPDEQAAEREDRQSGGGGALSRKTAPGDWRHSLRSHDPSRCELADDGAARGLCRDCDDASALRLGWFASSRPGRDALAQHQHPVADADHQPDDSPAHQFQHCRHGDQRDRQNQSEFEDLFGLQPRLS